MYQDGTNASTVLLETWCELATSSLLQNDGDAHFEVDRC